MFVFSSHEIRFQQIPTVAIVFKLALYHDHYNDDYFDDYGDYDDDHDDYDEDGDDYDDYDDHDSD